MYGRWYFAVTAVILAVLMWVSTAKKKLPWYLPLPLVICGFLLTVLPTDRRDTQALGIVTFGVQMLFIGVISLARYLREHPAPQA
jgi:Na+/phosphate symporter